MANPVHTVLTDAEAKALGGSVHSVGLPYLAFDDSEQSAPTLISKINTNAKVSWDLLVKAAMGVVVHTAGLNVHAYAADIRIGTTRRTFDGGSIALPANSTSLVYLNSAGTLAYDDDADPANWPEDVYRLAIVTTDATTVTSIADVRMHNYGVGAQNAWWTVLPAGDIDVNEQGLDNVGALVLSQLTRQIASGVLLVDSALTLVQAESGGTDDLDTITERAGTTGAWLIVLRGASGSTITVKHGTGNIVLPRGDCLINNLSFLVLMKAAAGQWIEIARSLPTGPNALTQDVNGQGYGIYDYGLHTWGVEEHNVASGSLALGTKSWHRVGTEGLAPTDDLDTVTGGGVGDWLILSMRQASITLTVKHSVSADGFRLANSRDFAMSTIYHTLICRHNGTQWVEITRSPMKLSDLVGTDNAQYVPIKFHLTGTPSTGNQKEVITLPHDCVIKQAKLFADTAPSGSPLIVDVLVNGSSMFANQGEMPQVAAGANSGYSSIKNHAYTANQTIRLEVEAVNAAADVTVVLDTYFKVQVPPS